MAENTDKSWLPKDGFCAAKNSALLDGHWLVSSNGEVRMWSRFLPGPGWGWGCGSVEPFLGDYGAPAGRG
ncbi:MAG TPA: hypothetical protein PKN20_03030, partial [Verrucomicrobiota bacterium]|nr:hypothetical protein [Verrucomicrobiota bacterium]